MKKSIVTLFIFLLISVPVFARRVRTVVLDDGGKRVETFYDKNDDEYRYTKKYSIFDRDGRKLKDESFLRTNKYNDLGIKKVTQEYYSNGNSRFLEVEFRDDVAFETGYQLLRLFTSESGVKRRLEIYYSDKKTDERIYSKSISYYNAVGKKTFARFYFTPKAREQTGLVRFEEEYDENEDPINQRFLTEDGRYR